MRIHLEAWWGRDLLFSSSSWWRNSVSVTKERKTLVPAGHPLRITLSSCWSSGHCHLSHSIASSQHEYLLLWVQIEEFLSFRSLLSGKAKSLSNVYLIRSLPSKIFLLNNKDNGFGILVTFAKHFVFAIKHKHPKCELCHIQSHPYSGSLANMMVIKQPSWNYA